MEMNVDFGLLGSTLFLMATTTIPVKLAADFVGASYTGMGSCALAVIIGTALSVGALVWLGLGPQSFALAFLAMTLTYKFVLSATFPKAVMLTIIAMVLQAAVIAAFISFGFWANTKMVERLSLTPTWSAIS